MKIYDVLILGAGASGLMCGAHLDKTLSVAIVEGNEKIAKKLKISGGGKCNITNVSVNEHHYDGDEELLCYALSIFSKEELLAFLAKNGVELELRKNRYYFCKNSSDEIINILKKKIQHHDLYLNEKITEVQKKGELFVVTTHNTLLRCQKLVVATGGKSFSTLGASDVGLGIAKGFGLGVKEFTPALVGLTLQKEQFWMKELSGLSCYVHIKVGEKIVAEEMLFTHKGISGPAVLSGSLYWKRGEISINFLPQNNITQLIKNSKKQISSVLPLPKRLSKALLEAIDVQDMECKKIDATTHKKLQELHSYTFAPAGNFGFSKAEVSRGGVLADELFAYSLETKKVKNLYFIGEVVDVTGELGGYNFQWAFSSAVVCAHSII